MSNKLYEESYIKDIADAIREVNGSSDTYKVSQMGEAIRSFKSLNEISIIWNEGYNCSYVIGSACDLTVNGSYCSSDFIEIEEGKTYTITFTSDSASAFRFIGVDSNNIVTEATQFSYYTGNNSFNWKPSEGTKKFRLRGYSGFSNLNFKLIAN